MVTLHIREKSKQEGRVTIKVLLQRWERVGGEGGEGREGKGRKGKGGGEGWEGRMGGREGRGWGT